MASHILKAPTIIRRKEVQARTGLSRSTIYARLKHNPKRPDDYDPTFPLPVSIGTRAVGWVEAEIDSWCVAQVEKSRGGSLSGGQTSERRPNICEVTGRREAGEQEQVHYPAGASPSVSRRIRGAK